jgi:hypothetical protein
MLYYKMCTTLPGRSSITSATEGKFSTMAVDKAVEKKVHIAARVATADSVGER